jgi:sialic acid synthase SpsE
MIIFIIECLIKTYNEVYSDFFLCGTFEFYGVLYETDDARALPVLHCIAAYPADSTALVLADLSQLQRTFSI